MKGMITVEENMKLTVSSTPHVRSKCSVDDIMLDVIIALMPAAFAGVLLFGQRALTVMLVSVLSCVGFELLYQILAHKKRTINDFSAVVTGMLLAFTLPSTAPVYVIIVASFVAIVITKQLFGGIGQNFMNPALVGRAFVLAAFPAVMTSFATEKISFFRGSADVLTGATPLSGEYMKQAPTVMEHLLGKYQNGAAIPGCIGETCALALLIGLAYLLIRRVISIRIPLSYIVSVMVMTLLFGHSGASVSAQSPILAVLSGGVLLGAIFMATDYVTTPTTALGQIVFGIGCGAITCVIRFWGGYPEGVTFAILLMNVMTPLIEKWTMPKPFGKEKE